MSKKDYFLLIDTETTQPGKDKDGNKIPAMVADFGAIIVDRKGREYARCAVMIAGVYGKMPLFYSSDPKDDVFGRHTIDRRIQVYDDMLDNGTRMLASINAVNRWLENVLGKYDPILTAYNIAFDVDKMNNTGIDTSKFDKRFCLWYAAQDKWGSKKAYREFILQLHEFTNRTGLGNMSYRTNAETMIKFVLGDPDFPDEPHTALEDALYYELPILKALVNSTPKKRWMNPKPYNWRNFQVKDWFVAR